MQLAQPAPTVTACIPYYRGRRYIRRAVDSLLAQTFRDLQVIVVNDGDPDPPWDELQVRDPRLIFFNLSRNHRGPFFANAVVADAAASPWFLVQEQDDWSAPTRVERLLELAADRRADVAISAQFFHHQQQDGSSAPLGLRWSRIGRELCPTCSPQNPIQHPIQQSRCQECFVDTAPTHRYWYRAPHAGLFRVDSLRRIGGYYAGLHLHYDSLLMNILLMTGTLAHTPDPLYHRLLRADSITHSRETGFGTPASDRERLRVAELYQRFFAEYQQYLTGGISSDALADSIRRDCEANAGEEDRRELAEESDRLRYHLAASRSRRAS